MQVVDSILLTASGITPLNIRPIAFQLAKKAHSAALITTAAREHKANNKHAVTTREAFMDFGIPQVDFVDVEFEVAAVLRGYDVVYLIGGHPFHLMHHLHRSGAAAVLREMHAERSVLLIGSSAGAVVLGPDLRIVSAFDPDLQEGYEPMAGLGIVPFTVLPHVNRWREKLPDLDDRLALFARETGLQVQTIADDHALLVAPDGTAWSEL